MSEPYRDFLEESEIRTEARPEAPSARRTIRGADGVIHLTASELTRVLMACVAALLLAGVAGGLIGHAIR